MRPGFPRLMTLISVTVSSNTFITFVTFCFGVFVAPRTTFANLPIHYAELPTTCSRAFETFKTRC